jgi:hypothetical protein
MARRCHPELTIRAQILKICAESQLDDTTARLAAAGAVWQFAKDGTVIQDVDAIDLLEWASLDLIHEDDFCETLGPLRVRTVKASPKDKLSAFRCLESCLIHWDLNSAQQVMSLMGSPAEVHMELTCGR